MNNKTKIIIMINNIIIKIKNKFLNSNNNRWNKVKLYTRLMTWIRSFMTLKTSLTTNGNHTTINRNVLSVHILMQGIWRMEKEWRNCSREVLISHSCLICRILGSKESSTLIFFKIRIDIVRSLGLKSMIKSNIQRASILIHKVRILINHKLLNLIILRIFNLKNVVFLQNSYF